MSTRVTPSRGFDGVRVIALESRRSVEMARLIESYGGVPRVAPSMREVPIERNQHALRFAAALLGGQFDMMIFLTGVGTRALTKVVETRYRREEFVEALTKVTVVARGPKPIAALKELRVPIDVKVPEPNTWRELLQAIDPVRAGLRVAVQEYGKPNLALIQGLRDRRAHVTDCVRGGVRSFLTRFSSYLQGSIPRTDSRVRLPKKARSRARWMEPSLGRCM